MHWIMHYKNLSITHSHKELHIHYFDYATLLMLPFWAENNMQIPFLCPTGYFEQLCSLTPSHWLWCAFSLSPALMLCSHSQWSERQLMLLPSSLLCEEDLGMTSVWVRKAAVALLASTPFPHALLAQDEWTHHRQLSPTAFLRSFLSASIT